jgi:hypothetical protein
MILGVGRCARSPLCRSYGAWLGLLAGAAINMALLPELWLQHAFNLLLCRSWNRAFQRHILWATF